MTTSLYDMSVSAYLQTIDGVISFLDKGKTFCLENGITLDEMVNFRLADDMLPLKFQILAVEHQSIGTIDAMQEGVFGPPASMPELSYQELEAIMAETKAKLQALSRESVDCYAGKSITFKMGDMAIPFTAENFVMSFSLPNFYFHAATAYDMLRIKGAPLGKRDFLGTMRVGA